MTHQQKEEYREAMSLLKRGYAIRDVAKLTGKGISTINSLASSQQTQHHSERIDKFIDELFKN